LESSALYGEFIRSVRSWRLSGELPKAGATGRCKPPNARSILSGPGAPGNRFKAGGTGKVGGGLLAAALELALEGAGPSAEPGAVEGAETEAEEEAEAGRGAMCTKDCFCAGACI
jgi:hypothetical protein